MTCWMEWKSRRERGSLTFAAPPPILSEVSLGQDQDDHNSMSTHPRLHSSTHSIMRKLQAPNLIMVSQLVYKPT